MRNLRGDQPIYTIEEFERESRYIEAIVWDAMVIEPGMSVLFCGFDPDGSQVARAKIGRAHV